MLPAKSFASRLSVTFSLLHICGRRGRHIYLRAVAPIFAVFTLQLSAGMGRRASPRSGSGFRRRRPGALGLAPRCRDRHSSFCDVGVDLGPTSCATAGSFSAAAAVSRGSSSVAVFAATLCVRARPAGGARRARLPPVRPARRALRSAASRRRRWACRPRRRRSSPPLPPGLRPLLVCAHLPPDRLRYALGVAAIGLLTPPPPPPPAYPNDPESRIRANSARTRRSAEVKQRRNSQTYDGSPAFNLGFGHVQRAGGESDPTRAGDHMAFVSAGLPRIDHQPCAPWLQSSPSRELLFQAYFSAPKPRNQMPLRRASGYRQVRCRPFENVQKEVFALPPH